MKGGKTGTGRSETAPATASVGNVLDSNVSGKSVAHQSAAEFAATLQEIDGAINEGSEIQILNKDDNEVPVDQEGKKTDMEISVAAEDADINSHDDQLTPRFSQLGEHVPFTAGWVENDKDKKGRRGGACGIRSKIQASDKGPSRAIIGTGPKPNGTWVRMHDMPRSLGEQKKVEQEGPKRKKRNQVDVEGGIQEKEKKPRIDEETKNLSMLMASEFTSAEVAKQPCREQ
nr:hypothetical protein CFP56_68050 [Quercus suber]